MVRALTRYARGTVFKSRLRLYFSAPVTESCPLNSCNIQLVWLNLPGCLLFVFINKKEIFVACLELDFRVYLSQME